MEPICVVGEETEKKKKNKVENLGTIPASQSLAAVARPAWPAGGVRGGCTQGDKGRDTIDSTSVQ